MSKPNHYCITGCGNVVDTFNKICSECAKDSLTPDPKPTPVAPQHAFEVRITIGGETWEYVQRAAQEIADYIESRAPNTCNLASGGGGGCHGVTVFQRDVTPEAYREELENWRQSL